jgi:hypothetical protein
MTPKPSWPRRRWTSNRRSRRAPASRWRRRLTAAGLREAPSFPVFMRVPGSCNARSFGWEGDASRREVFEGIHRLRASDESQSPRSRESGEAQAHQRLWHACLRKPSVLFLDWKRSVHLAGTFCPEHRPNPPQAFVYGWFVLPALLMHVSSVWNGPSVDAPKRHPDDVDDGSQGSCGRRRCFRPHS